MRQTRNLLGKPAQVQILPFTISLLLFLPQDLLSMLAQLSKMF